MGSVILLATKVPGFQVARALIGGVALTGGLVFLLTAGFLIRARKQKVVTGPEQLLRETAVALEDFEHTGMVRLRGEIWRAQSASPVRKGQQLRVLHVTGLGKEFDVSVPEAEGPKRLAAALAAGGRIVDHGTEDWTLSDAAGNQIYQCVRAANFGQGFLYKFSIHEDVSLGV